MKRSHQEDFAQDKVSTDKQDSSTTPARRSADRPAPLKRQHISPSESKVENEKVSTMVQSAGYPMQLGLPMEEGEYVAPSGNIEKVDEVVWTTTMERDEAAEITNNMKTIDTIGRGTFSSVIKLQNVNNGNVFAAKIYSKRVLQRQRFPVYQRGGGVEMSTFLDRIGEEIEILSMLRHPNIITLHEVFDDPSDVEVYMIFELLNAQIMYWSQPGACYSIRDQPKVDLELTSYSIRVLSEGAAMYVYERLRDAVQFMHSKRVVHKDLKPDNTLVSSRLMDIQGAVFSHLRTMLVHSDWNKVDDGGGSGFGRDDVWPDANEEEKDKAALEEVKRLRTKRPLQSEADRKKVREVLDQIEFKVKLCDFNSAVVTEDDDLVIWDSMGTQAFTPPECFAPGGEGYDGGKRDMWSIGVTLYTFLFGELPYWAETAIGTQLQILSQEIKFPFEEIALSEEMQNLLKRLLAKDPAERSW